MGCICSRQAYVLDYGSPKGGGAEGKGSNRPSARWLVSSHRKEESAAAEITKTAVQSEPRNNKISVSNGLKNEKRRSSPGAGRSLEEEEEEKNRKGRRRRTKGEEEEEQGRNGGVDRQLSFEVSNIPGGIPRHVEAEQVAAGWPAWLTAVAGEAIRGWIPRKAESFEKLYKIGQGTYSNVYKARDLDNGKIVALKKVRFDNLEPESVRFMAREIQVLRRLDHPNIVKLEGLVTSGLSCSLYLVFEYMEHDLAGLAACPGIKFSEPQVKCYMQQLLCGLDHCHSRGVLHRDIKGSNLLIDNGGNLKIADFGLATFFRPGQKQVLTSRVVTLWYRPPELLLGATDYGVSVDLWSTGCILAELLTGKPIMPGRTEVEQLHKIFKLCGSPSEEYWKKSKLPHATIFKPQHPYKCCIAETFKDFPPTALALLQTLLAIEPADRGEATGALKSEFFTTKPLPCDPSTLPKYPPSKEFDAKLRAEEARRQRAAGGRALGPEVARRASRQARGGPAPDATAESLAPTQKQHMSVYGASNNRNGKSTPKQHESHIDPPRPVHHPYESTAGASRVVHGTAFSGPLLYGDGTGSTFGKKHKEDGIDRLPGRSPFQSSKASIGSDLKTHGKQPAGDLSKTARSGGGRKYDVTETYKYQGSLLQQNLADALVGIQNGKHEESKVSEPSAKQNRAHLQKPESLDRLDSDLSGGYAQRDERHASREPFKGRGTREQRILYSGPLLPPSANIDEILQKHEQNIQRAVRRARHSKGEAVRNASEHKSSVPSPKGKQGSSNLKGEREHLSSLMENRGRKQEI